MSELRVHFLPELAPANDLTGGTCVVVDVLRATTTIIYALAAGARAVIPCLSIDDARERAARFGSNQVALGGERGGVPIAGFDLGNSPAEYTSAAVGGKTVVLTTTNGTKALLQGAPAAEILIGAFVNLAAVCAVLKDCPRVDLLCAGTDGQITREDVLFAGAVVARLASTDTWRLNDQAVIARDAWLRIMAHAAPEDVQPRLIEAMRESRGGRNLVALGMDADIGLAAEIDRLTIVPRFNRVTGEIEAG